jgi:DNA-binding MarR family transcriptional regulator
MVEDVVEAMGLLCLGTRLKRIGERLQADTQRIMSALDDTIPVSQHPLIAALDRLGPLTIGELAEAVGISQPGVTRSVAQLIDQGFLRVVPAEDQRRRIVDFSEKGRQAAERAKAVVWPRVEAAVADACGGRGAALLDQLAAIEGALDVAPLTRRPLAPSRMD